MSNGITNRKIRLAWHGEWGLSTGFGGVSKNILDRLHNVKTDWGTQKYEIISMALGIGADPHRSMDNVAPYKVVPMYGDRNRAPFGQDYAQDFVRRYRPDIIVTFGDTWMLDFWNDENIIPKDLRKTFKLVAYVAIDGYPIPKFWIDKYKKFDKVITFTKFGKDAIDERSKDMGIKLNSSYIYHGVDTNIFRPVPKADIDNFKRSRGIDLNKKVIGMVARNQPRKHHPEFIEFAAELLERVNGDPNYVFYLHCVNQDAGWNIGDLIEDIDKLQSRKRFLRDKKFFPGQSIPERTYNLAGRFMFPGFNNPGEGYPLEILNMIYNTFDAHVLLTSGEGMGCPIQEGLSAGIPTFTNDYAASAELVVDSQGGEVIESRDFTYRGSDHNFYRPHTDYKDAVDKVLKVINDETLKTKMKKKARAYSLGCSWDVILLDWQKELDSVFEYDRNITPVVV